MGPMSVSFALPRVTAEKGLTLREAEAFPETLYAVSDQAELNGTCRNDVFLLISGPTKLAGRFENDVWAFSDSIHFSGHAMDHLRLLGKTVEVDGEVANTVSVAAGAVRIGPNAVLKNGLAVIGEDVILAGQVEGNARIRATRATLSGQVTGDLDLEATDIVVLSGTRIDGDFIYTGERDLILDQGVVVTGKMFRRPPAEAPSLASQARFAAGLYGSALLVALPLVFFFPRGVSRSVRRLRKGFGRCLLVGAALFSLTPFLALLAAATVIGLPLSGVLLGVCGLALYLGHIVTAVWVGSLLLGRRGPQSFDRVFPVLAIGLLVGYSLWLVPAAAILIGGVASLAGAGALLLAATGRIEPPPLPVK